METDDAHILGRLLLSAALAGYGLLTLRADLGDTHATNPRWSGHARFHVVWQSLGNAAIVVLALALVWWPGPSEPARLYLAGLLGGIILASFFITTLFRRLFGGTLRDNEGEEALEVELGSVTAEIDANIALFAILTIILIAGVVTVAL